MSFTSSLSLIKKTSVNSIQLSWSYFFNLEIQLIHDEITNTRAEVASLLRLWSSFDCTRYLNENERSKTINENLFVNVSNNIDPFVWIIWHKKEPLGCVVYWHCPTNGSYKKCIHNCCLRCNYVTKHFGILQRVIKSQRVLTSFENQKSTPSLFIKISG